MERYTQGPGLLVINPNTNPAVTARIQAYLACAMPQLSAEVTSPDDGPPAIQSPEDRAHAVPAVLQLIRQQPERAGYIMACFDDIAVAEARSMVAAPVISLAQAAIEAGRDDGKPFTIVTTVERQVPTIEGLLARYGAANGKVVACGAGVGDAAAETPEAEGRLRSTITEAARGGARAIVLGSGAYCGRAAGLEAAFALPFIEPIGAAIDAVLAPQPAG